MKIKTEELNLRTKGAGDLINITGQIEDALAKIKLMEGIVCIFVIGSTAAITSFEYESGLISDIKDLYEKLIPSSKSYAHDQTWGDANGFSHLRAALQGPSLVIPISSGRLSLGTWQQIVLAEFDTRPRQRNVILKFIGE
ncbi:MAG: YjbQ family protein [Candidatus Omnitrophica bacterium]|nr:YjbQ family protein [Candidatus Omnitrophota bacterium]